MAARKALAGFAVLVLGAAMTPSVATAISPCSYRACNDEVAASGLSRQARGACIKHVIADCRAGRCSCTGGSPPCSCVCGDGLCGPAEDCSMCPGDCGPCPTTTTTTLPCSICFLTVSALCLGPCTTDADCGNQPNLYCFSVTEVERLTGVTCPCPTTTTTTSTSVASTSTSTTSSTTSTSLVMSWCSGSDFETPCGTLTFCDQPGENPPPCNSSALACRWAQLACQADVDRIALSLSSLPPPDLFRASGDCSGTQQFSLDGSSVLNLTCARCCPNGMEITLP
jgi:hypothetical protein